MRPCVVLLTACLALLAACGGPAREGESLERAVHEFNNSLRWKRFAQAATYLPAELRDAFLAQRLLDEDLLHLDLLEVRGVTEVAQRLEDEPQAFEVTLLAQGYVLPRTVVERFVVRQRWEQAGQGWMLVAAHGAAWAELPEAGGPRASRPQR